ncbi:MAG TPA: hypothetical protein VL614_00805 [Acetobacteraceae bacterium]|jgi:hypothetical protein|nr:hypothetical protein [Acetobacteraceae bacterium]
MKRLLTLGASQPKAVKGEKKGYLTAVLHLAPHTSAAVTGKSGHVLNVCPNADGCEIACLNTAGHGGIIRKGETTNAIQEARKARTRWLFSDRAAFLAQLERELRNFARNAERKGMGAALRLNGTSDLDFDGLAPSTVALAESLGLKRYDYTKVASRAKRVRPTYHVTFSLSAGNDNAAGAWLRNGGNVAVVFRTADLPATYTIDGETRPVVNGDDSDLRFLDDVGVIVGLKAKGKARRDQSGFVRDAA